MKPVFCFQFSDGMLSYLLDGQFVEEQLFEFPIHFFAADFSAFVAQSANFQSYYYRPADESAEQVAQISAGMLGIHPLISRLMRQMERESQKLRWLHRTAGAMQEVQSELLPVFEAVFLPNPSSQTASSRLRDLISASASLTDAMHQLHDAVHLAYLSAADGDARLVFSTDDLRPFLLILLYEMARQQMRLKKCANCGQYFRPYSSRTLYCDRIVPGTEKTCKELAAKDNYEKKVASDSGKALFLRRCKTYAMRVSRSPEVYTPESFRLWKQQAEPLLARFAAGALDYDSLDRALALPEKQKK